MASSSTPTYAREGKLWNLLGWTLCFLDTLGGALFLPVLPALVQVLGSSSPASTAAWIGLLASVYFASRSGSLAALRWFSSSSSSTVAVPKPSPVRLGVLLMLSAALYLACGLTVRRDSAGGLWWLAALRALAGMLAAAHRALGCGCLDQTGLAPVTLVRKSRHESSAVSLLVSFTLASALFNPHRFRPTLEMCLAAAVMHAPACVALVLLWQRNAGRGRTVADSSRYSTVRGTPGGSDAELELMGRQPWGARDSSSSGDGRRSSEVVAVAAAAAAEAAAAATAPSAARAADTGVSGRGEAGLAPGKVDGEMVVPGRYLRGCKGDVVEAERRWRLTLDWRAKERVDEVLREPQPHFDVIKRHYPHFIHRHARNGCPVWIELPGRIDLPAIRSGGVSPEALQRHYVFVTEYLWGIVEPDFENGQAVTVLDVQGLGMRDLAGEALGFVKQATAIVQDHYVERSNRMFIVNAPSYFSMIWRVIRPMLNERTQAKIGIINTDKKKIAEALLECIAPEDLPRQYGGTCPLDLGESEEEVDLRAYVSSITPSLAPPAPRHDNDDEEDGALDLEVEVDLHAAPAVAAGSRADGGPVGSAEDGAGDGVSSASPPHGGGDARGEEDRKSGERISRPGAARRALGTVTGALTWAGGKFSWQRSPVAHLGDENGFEYDPDLQRWVLRDVKEKGAAGGRRASGGGGGDRSGSARASGGGDGRKERGGSRGHPSSSRRPVRSGSMGSSTSEEMTVLAIQAAHHSLAEVGTKLSPVPSEVSAVPGALDPGIGRLPGTYSTPDGGSRLKYSNAEEGSREASGLGRHHPPRSGSHAMDSLEVRLPCAKTGRSRCCRLELASALYVSGVAVREALPLWLLSGASVGGVGAASPQIGMLFAAGVVLAEAAGAVASAGWCGALWVDGSGGGAGSGGGGRRLLVAVRARFVVAAVLGLTYLLSRLLSAFPSAVLWAAVTAAVAANHAALELCKAAVFQRSSARSSGGGGGGLAVDVSDGEDRARATSSESCGRYRGYRGTASGGGGGGGAPPSGTMVISASALVGDVLGAAAGPFLIALALCTGWPSPFDSSSWLVLCLCADLWLSTWSREAEPQHAGLLFAEDGGPAEEEHRAGRFAQFV